MAGGLWGSTEGPDPAGAAGVREAVHRPPRELLRGKIEGYKGEKIAYGKETTDPPYAEVRTTIVTPQGQGHSVDYRLVKGGDRWRVYDVVIEG